MKCFFKQFQRILCLFFCLFLTTPVLANNTANQPVVVGWYEDAYNITGENGERSGYGYEYQQAVAAYTGWTYQYKKAGWSDLLKLIEEGKIDLMGGVSYTDERAKKMLFSEFPMGEEKYYLYADLVHTNISASDLSTLNEKRIGMLEGSVQATQFFNWEKKHNLHLQYVYLTSFEDAKKKVANQEIDCVISTETPQWPENGLNAIATVGGSDIYFVINKNRPDLKEELDNAMRKMEYDKPFYADELADELYKRYLSAASNPVLSNEEQDWLHQHGKIKIGYLKGDVGFSSVDSTGRLVGVIQDYKQLAKNCLGNGTLNFELIGYDSLSDQLSALKKHKIDMIFHMCENPYIAETNGFTLSNTVLTVGVSAVTNKSSFNEEDENRVAIDKKDELMEWYISYYYPKWKIIEYDSLAAAEKDVQEQIVDCLVSRSGQISRYVDNSKLRTVSLMQTGNTCFAVRRGDTTLLSILNKTLKTVSSSMLTGSLSMYDTSLKKVTAVDFIKDNLLIVSLSFTFVFIIVLVLILNLLKKSRKAENTAKEAVIKMQSLNKALQESHDDLENALSRAESANLAKTTFLNNMSHDIRTPMNAIIGFTNMALKQDTNVIVKNCLNKISDSSELLLTLINDVLDISRIESGQLKFNLEVTDITNVTDSVINVAYGLLTHRNITFEIHREKPENPYVMADSVRIREILVNILGNAIKFTDDGGWVRFTSSYTINKDLLMARFEVSDTGIGMSKEFQEHLFDEFSQENADARTQYKGTGLGLAITKRYVDMMQGMIRVKSEKNKGSTFVVELPLQLVNQEQMKNLEVPVHVDDVKGLHVLLAEDNDLNAEIVKAQLEEMKIQVTRAKDGQDVVEIFEQNSPNTFDLILMDVMMPKMNGYQAAQTIRNLERKDGKSIPIIALTANAFAEDVQASLDAGMNFHLSKPIVQEALIKVIARSVRKAR